LENSSAALCQRKHEAVIHEVFALAGPRRGPRLFKSDGFDQGANEGYKDTSKILHSFSLHTPSYTEADPFPPKLWKESASICRPESTTCSGEAFSHGQDWKLSTNQEEQ
jgi:hypothetical protein